MDRFNNFVRKIVNNMIEPSLHFLFASLLKHFPIYLVPCSLSATWFVPFGYNMHSWMVVVATWSFPLPN